MKKKATWVIINTITNKALYGIKDKTLAFTTSEIAHEVAQQFFEVPEHYLVVEIPDLKD